MIIALDYDGTISADPFLWRWFVYLAKGLEHTVHIVTARSSEHLQDIKEWADPLDVLVFATNTKPKRNYMFTEHGIIIDVWIDDCPEAIPAFAYDLTTLYKKED